MSIFASMRSVTEAFGDAEHDPSQLPEADGGGYEGGWLCPTKADRVRLTEMSPAVRRARMLAGVFCGVGVWR